MASPSCSPPPDHLRCHRSDGRSWRCKHPVIPPFSHCELHLSEAQRRRFESREPPTAPRRGRRPKLRPEPPPDPPAVFPLVDFVRTHLPRRRRRQRLPVTRESLSLRVLPACPVLGTSQNPILAGDSGAAAIVPAGKALPVDEEMNDHALEDPKDVGEDAGPVEEGPVGREVLEQARGSGCSEEVPEEFRCRRTDGKQWRCRRRAMEDHYFCEIHRIQAFRRQHKMSVPEALKLRRGHPPPAEQKPVVGVTLRKRRKRQPHEEDVDVPRKVKRRRKMGVERVNERPLANLVRMVLRRKKQPGKGRKRAVTKASLSARSRDEVVSVPEHLRCRRTDGKRWRCSRPALENLSFCEVHHIQAHRRQYKLGVPEHLKLKRRPRGPALHPWRSSRVIAKRMEDMDEDELRRAVRMEKRRKENEALLVEVMRLVLQRQLEKRRREQKQREEQGDMQPEIIKKVLPNGVMCISPGSSHDLGKHLDMKIGLDSSSFLRWCFRSKNVDSPPVGSLQRLPYARKHLGLGKSRKRVCHHCRTSVGRILRCSSCRKTFFCKRCIKEWYSELSDSDVRMSCPICRGKCCCAVCKSSKMMKDQPL